MIAPTARVFENVHLGENVVIEDFCLIGVPPRGFKEGELRTVIGDNAIIRSHTIIYAGNSIGNSFETGNKVNIRELNKITNNVSIGTLSVIEHRVSLGEGVRIHSQVFVPEFTVIGDHAWLGPNVVLTNAKYPNRPDTKAHLKGPRIHPHCVIGANSTILPGIVLGEKSIVGAGSVVTKHVEPGWVVAGNPAKLLKRTSKLSYNDEGRYDPLSESQAAIPESST